MTKENSKKITKSKKIKNTEKTTSNKVVHEKNSQKGIWGLVLKVVLLLIWTASVVIVSQLLVGFLMLMILGRDTLVQPAPTAIYSALSYILAFCIIFFITPKLVSKRRKIKCKKMGREELGLRGLPTWTDIGLAPVGFAVSLILAAGLVAIFNMFPWFDAEEVQDVGFNAFLFGADRIVAFLALVVIAPIAEELIFRVWLYSKLRSMLSERLSNVASMLISIFLVSLLFGIIHMQWNVGVNVFALSVVLCGLREITGTIYAGMLVHIIKNGVAFYLIYVLGIR